MERSLSILINNKNLLYIIQEYSRKEYLFLKELKTNIMWLCNECDKYWFYDKYFLDTRLLKHSFVSKICYHKYSKWDINYACSDNGIYF